VCWVTEFGAKCGTVKSIDSKKIVVIIKDPMGDKETFLRPDIDFYKTAKEAKKARDEIG